VLILIKGPLHEWQKVQGIQMARRDNTEVEQVETIDDGVETSAVEGTETAEKPAKAKKEAARGALPEGYVTPVGLATALSQPIDGDKENTDSSNFRHTDKNGEHTVKPQMVYSYMKNASKEHAFPIEVVQDSLGHDRQALKLEAGLAWWDAKNSRVAERKANAGAKAEKKAAKAAEAPAEGTAEAQVVEAE
jgi:hypothetical protein